MRVLIPAAELARRVAELAGRIDADYRLVGDGGGGRRGHRPRAQDDPLIAVGVLKGSVFFLADLLKRLRVPVAVDFLQTASYGAGGEHRGEMRIRKDLDLSIRGRDVLLVEDIVDTGFTARTILDLLRHRGARSVRLCALLDKTAARQVEVPIDYRGFAIENVFVVGYGLDHGERYRNLPYIAVWQAEGEPPATAPTAPTPPTSERSISGMQFHHTDQAPAAIGPYSQAVSVDGWLYTSGQVGLDPATGELVAGGFEAQARRALENLRQVLASAGCGFSDVVKATVYVVDLADFPRLNALYGEAMAEHRPARSTVQAAALPRGALVEIDLVARLRPGAG
ncbi:MAG TPA: hypoxanthine phosphoribosyltransferase [Thermoanaerobaculia bacterium]|nr:hypoxanthine phosphoribosyltransferase [Thermoanaerobaculia bacterium]